MYKLEYLPSALRDMTEIARYISAELKSPAAAEKLAEELIEAAERTAAFPYANPVYVPIRQLKREYRKRARVIYARRELCAALGKERRVAEEP